MDFDTAVKLALYHATAETGKPPRIDEVARRVGAAPARLSSRPTLDCGRTGCWCSSRTGAPFAWHRPISGVPTQHQVDVDGVTYHANCAWDALGIAAALRRPGLVRSRCEQSLEPSVWGSATTGPSRRRG